jgi:hypothetical protein
MSGCRSASGLVCSAGSTLDFKIPRAKMPKSALPDSVRRKMGLKPRKERARDVRLGRAAGPTAHSNAGAGVVKQRTSKDGKYAAGCQKNFLKRGTGVAMSSRASRLAQQQTRGGNSRRTTSTRTEAASRTSSGSSGGSSNIERRRKPTQRPETNARGQSEQAMPREEESQQQRDQQQREDRRTARMVAARRRQLNKE